MLHTSQCLAGDMLFLFRLLVICEGVVKLYKFQVYRMCSLCCGYDIARFRGTVDKNVYSTHSTLDLNSTQFELVPTGLASAFHSYSMHMGKESINDKLTMW